MLIHPSAELCSKPALTRPAFPCNQANTEREASYTPRLQIAEELVSPEVWHDTKLRLQHPDFRRARWQRSVRRFRKPRLDRELSLDESGERSFYLLHDLNELVFRQVQVCTFSYLARFPVEKLLNPVGRLVVVDGLVMLATQQQQILLRVDLLKTGPMPRAVNGS